MHTSQTMTRNIVTISPAVGVRAAGRLMDRMKIRHLPVVSDGKLVGIVSDRDLLRHGVEAPGTCGQVMTAAPITCSPDTPIGRVAAMMIEHKIDSIPVVEKGKLAGLVTSSDLLALLVERDQAKVLPFDFRLRMARTDEDQEALLAEMTRDRLLA